MMIKRDERREGRGSVGYQGKTVCPLREEKENKKEEDERGILAEEKSRKSFERFQTACLDERSLLLLLAFRAARRCSGASKTRTSVVRMPPSSGRR